MTYSQRSPRAIGYLHNLVWAAVCAAIALPASAQTFPFLMRLQQGTSVTTIANQGTIGIGAAGLNQPAQATLTVTNQSTSAITITSGPLLAQSNQDFSATIGGTLPLALNPGDSFIVKLQYTPSVTTSESSLLSINYTQGLTTGSIQLTLLGASGMLAVSYTMPPNLNTVPLASGGTVQFPATQVNSSTTATMSISNTGAAPGVVTAISIPAGTPFQLVGLQALLPYTVNPGTQLVFGVKYTPTQAQTDTGSLTINIGGTISTYNLSGSGITSSYSYSMSTNGGAVTPITPGTTIQFPDTALTTNSTFFIQVRDIGGAAGTINAINATGAFSVSDGPTIFPVTLNPNDQITFTLTFTPTQPGQLKGKLTVGNDVFDLAGTGLGPKLTFAYGPANVSLLAQGTAVFPATQVGQSSQMAFVVTNAGTSAATITSIAVADTKGIFSIIDAPSAGATLNPNDTLTFQIKFAPTTTGFSTTTLQVDTQSFTLSGSGTQPPALPSFQFTGASGSIGPLQQPAIGLTLSAPYSLELTGTLTISVNSGALIPDPTVQFATSGRTVAFTIPANSTDAIFPTGGNQISLQVGTTAATITITPTFTTRSGLDITPQPPPTLTLSVTSAAPKLLTIQVTNVTQAAFSVGVTGLSTTHSLSTLTYQFTPTGGGKPVSYSIDVTASAGLWYSSTASQGFGGQFSVAVPFALPNPSTTALSTSGIQSISVTANNAQGPSNTISLSLQ